MLLRYAPQAKQISAEQLAYIEKLNLALACYHQNPSKENLNSIIDACESYIKTIPQTERTKFSDDTWENVLKEWPDVIAIRDIQKKAVALLFLPEADTLAKARWQLLKNLIKPASNVTVSLKLLDEEFWSEFKFCGKPWIACWLMDNSYEDRIKFRTFRELIANEAAKNSFDSSHVDYIEDPSIYQINFKQGKVHQAGILFDTKKATGTNVATGECIFTVSAEGKFYCNNPSEILDPSFHHSSFLQGKPALAAGTLKVDAGVITQITMISGHYKPGRKELLNLLRLLKDNQIDISQITVIDSPTALPKNALRYLNLRGFTFYHDKKVLLEKLADEAFEKVKRYQIKSTLISLQTIEDLSRETERVISLAIAHGSDKALLMKAIALIELPNLFCEVNDKQRLNIACEILSDLHQRKTSMAYQAKNILAKYFPNAKKLKKKEVSCRSSDSQKLLSLNLRLRIISPYPQEVNASCLRELENLICSKRNIQSLFEFYLLLLGPDGDFLRLAMPVSQVDLGIDLPKVLLILQRHAFDVATELKRALSKTEEEILQEIWGATESNIYKEKFKAWVEAEKVKIASQEPVILSGGRSFS